MPWESKKQQRWGHGRGGKKAGFTPEKIKEWDKKTDFESLPEKAACGVAVSDCAEVACCKTGTCQQAMAYTLSWGPRQLMLVEELNWTGAADSAEARPCTEGDDDSQYGPRGDDQKCVDEGGEGGGYYDEGPDCTTPGCDLEEGHRGTHVTPESTEEARDRNRQRSAEEGGGYDEPASDVPEGFQEVDMGDPSLDPEGGDWEEFLEKPEEEMDLKKTLKEEDKSSKEEQKTQEQKSKEQSRTAISIPRDPNLDPNAYHQFWDPSHTGHSGLDEQRNYTLQKSVKILEDRANNPRSPEDAEAARSILMNGPKAGGTYQKTKKAEPGEPGAEDFYQKEDRSPII